MSLNSFIELQRTQNTVIQPLQQITVPVRSEATYATTNGAAEATPALDRMEALLVSPAPVTLVEGRTTIQKTDHNNYIYTLVSCVAMAIFKVMTPHQAANTKPVPHAPVLLMNNHLDGYKHILYQLFHEQTNAKRCNPTPETYDDPGKLNKIEKRKYDKIMTLRGKEQLNPTKTDEQLKKIL